MKGFNLNDHVWVRLTPAGEAIWRAKWEDVAERVGQTLEEIKARECVNGWWHFQLWELMALYGHTFWLGMRLDEIPFVDNEIHFHKPY